MSVKILGVGSALPEKIVSNTDLEKLVDTSDEWISTRTGIKQRHIATGETALDLGTEAARIAIEAAGVDPQSIDMVICSTLNADHLIPSVAGNIRGNLGIEKAAAFDLSTACTGFIYSVTIAESMIKTCGYRNVLVVASELMSRSLDWTDRATCVLFGDGAGAAVVGKTDHSGIIASYIEGANDQDESVVHHNTPVETPFYKPEPHSDKVQMKGSKVFNFAVKVIPETIHELLSRSGKRIEDIKWIVPHQANRRIVLSAANRSGIDMDKFYINIDRVANTSSASIPIALHEMVEKKILQSGDLVLLTAFGGGLSYGGVLLEW